MFSVSDIIIEKVTKSRIDSVDFDNIPFGKVFSDHMFEADYKDGTWQNMTIKPYGKLSIMPGNTILHYSQTIFEGMKAYRNASGEPVLFRPVENFKRLNISAERMCIPALPEELFMEALHQLVGLDQDWIPKNSSTSLYIRPFVFACDDYIGIRPSHTYKFIIFTCPASKYYAEALKVKIEAKFTRAVAGGTGYAKTGGNYAGSHYPTKKAEAEGYQQLIWTDGKTHEYIEESGTMNLFFVKNGQLITAPVSDSILDGITRKSIIQLAKDNDLNVTERPIKVTEVIDGLKDGSITEAFGAGTAATIAKIKAIGHGKDQYPLPNEGEGEIANLLYDKIEGIKRGKYEDTHGWIVPIK